MQQPTEHTTIPQQAATTYTTPPAQSDMALPVQSPVEETNLHTEQPHSPQSATDTTQLTSLNTDKHPDILKQELFTLKTKQVKITHHLTFLRDTLQKEVIPDGLKLTHTLQAMDTHMTDITNEWNHVLHNTSKSLQRLLYFHYEELLELTERKIQALDKKIQTQHAHTNLTKEQQDKITKLDTKLEQTRNKKIAQLTQTQHSPRQREAPGERTQQLATQGHKDFLAKQQNHPTTQRSPPTTSTQRAPRTHPRLQASSQQHPPIAPQALPQRSRQTAFPAAHRRTLLPTPAWHNTSTPIWHTTPIPTRHNTQAMNAKPSSPPTPPWIPPPILLNRIPLLAIPPLNPIQLRQLQHSLQLPLH